MSDNHPRTTGIGSVCIMLGDDHHMRSLADRSGNSGSGGSAGASIAFLMPDTASTRYELHDRPGFENRLKELCPDCKPLYNNADGSAEKRQVMDMTRRILKMEKVARPDDAADAIAIALCHARSATSLLARAEKQAER